MTLIADLIDIPEQVHRGDFVLRLSQGVTDPAGTLRDYVIPEQLVACFDSALGFVRSAVEGRTSKAAYLHGSFGSGKSHFMAVLHLLLQHNPEVRAVKELESVVAKHSRWLDGKKFLLVPYHLIGAKSMEAAIFGHYMEHVRALHPDAPLPGVFLSERLFEDARRLRQAMGDEAFFRSLEAGRPASAEGWGALGARWTPATFDAAISAPPRDEARVRLVGDLVSTHFQSYSDMAAGSDKEAYVPLDVGLSILSKHARALGYDALILFLDELILWLASHMSDLGFVAREGQKLAKLVEAQTADRPTPVVSFIARQRDLRELVGEHVPGADRLGFGDVLKYWEDRFHKITLEDRNLPRIVEKRVLRTRTPTARKELDGAFEAATRVRDEVMGVLLTSESDRAMFKMVYPFSPALIQALVAVSSVLQRERTALKILLMLLVSRRADLQLGDIVPVGDLWDVISEGDEPFSEVMRLQFDNARRLYVQKLLPMLERPHHARAEELRSRPRGDAAGDAFRADERLVKTLLLAALVPNVESFRSLTASRLAALNHGSIRSPIPGREGRDVLGKCRTWASEVGEIKIGEDPTNPTIQIQLSGVDTESILSKAQSHDNEGNRRLQVRRLLFGQLGIPDEDQLFHSLDWIWRGWRRRVQVVYANVRTLPDESLRAREDEWRLVIDYPFDEEGHTPKDDIACLERFREGNEPTRTLCWLPRFFSRQMRTELGRFVIIEYILAGERFADYASHLSVVDRAAARALLENQRSQLRQRLISALEVAYGVTSDSAGLIDGSHDLEDTFQSLDPAFRPRPPAGATLKATCENLLDQMLSHQYPAHPRFTEEVRPNQVKKVLAEVRRAIAEPTGRIVIDKELRPVMRAIANPLLLGEMTEGDAFLLGRHWYEHFRKSAAATSSAEITVGKLRTWMDQPTPMGLPPLLQNLVILIFADQDKRSFHLHGGPTIPSLEALSDELELRTQQLPDSKLWASACQRAEKIFGLTPPHLVSATHMTQLEADLRRSAATLRPFAEELRLKLAERLRLVGVAESGAARLTTANAAHSLVEGICGTSTGGAIAAIGGISDTPSAELIASSLKKAAEVSSALGGTRWTVVEGAWSLEGADAPAAAALRSRVEQALVADELHQPLAPVLSAVEDEAARLLAKIAKKQTEKKKEPVERTRGTRIVAEQHAVQLDAAAAQKLFRDLEQKLGESAGRRLTVDWRIEEPEER